MAINFTDFSKIAPQDSPLTNLWENAFKGYQMGRAPKQMDEEQKQRQLAIALKEKDLGHKDKEFELSDQQKSLANSLQSKALENYDEVFKTEQDYKKAQINNLNKPQGLKGALAAAFQLRNNLNPDDPNYDKDKNAINNYINNLGQKSGSVPITQPGEGIKINLPEGKEGYIPGIGKLKPGWQSVKDAQGNDIGVNVPMSDKQIEQWKAKEKFDIIYPFLNDSLSQYTGQNSWENFTRDAQNYNKDAEAKQRIDNFFAAKKLISIGSTTENARIGGHATNVQLDELRKTLDSSEVFNKLESGGGYILPSKYAKNSGNIFKGYLDKVEKAAKTNIPAYEFRSLNPNDNNPSAPEKSSDPVKSNPKIIKTEGGFTTIRNGGKTFRIPENLVDQYMIEHSQSEFGGQYD